MKKVRGKLSKVKTDVKIVRAYHYRAFFSSVQL